MSNQNFLIQVGCCWCVLECGRNSTRLARCKVADMITHSIRRTPKRERNLCVILGCLAEKLAGPSSIAVLSDVTLGYLLGNLDEGIHPDVMLFSLIALEKFAQTSENKATIKRKLALYPENPLTRLERHIDSKEFILRQVGFCARWCLDNYSVHTKEVFLNLHLEN
ncbi:conserved hypothetical protein [Culex quinquefasciatus]|uniref:Uncharacterized protein n=1 Tax=Culex quinquefasciatus TaxID=7176 RepID=B0XKF2_CULQU|nr:conserved hypothetical protein [Culex quinquefasciatus]|eukprot:XP_001870124.1 conserved hypothetical protein [Culex quinquefasciatus]